jgi:hypothetical protein
MIHIGKKIEAIATEKGVRPTDLARKIGKTSQSIYDIYKRDSLTTDLLKDIGEALSHDFFKYYTVTVNEDNPTYSKPAPELKPTISITINNIDEAKFQRIFKKINELIQ